MYEQLVDLIKAKKCMRWAKSLMKDTESLLSEILELV